MSSELLMVRQRSGEGESAPWILDRNGRVMQGRDDGRRAAELEQGLARHPRVVAVDADARDEDVERVLAALHEDSYLAALREVSWEEPRLTPEWKPPGLPADSPVWAGVVTTAFEGARGAISAARRIATSDRFAYAVCRPPGHHAGPSWMGGYCYLNTAAAAAKALLDLGVSPVAILDLDFHFPTGTAAVVERMDDVLLHSLHASTLEEVPWREVRPRAHERFVNFTSAPDPGAYLDALRSSVEEIAQSAVAIVLSMGYDTVGGDPHGSWSLPPETFADVGRALAASGLPVCVVQEGGYALELLARCSHAFARGLLNGEVS